MKKYFCNVKTSMLVGLSYRVHFLVSVLSNILKIVLLYYMWFAVYGMSHDKIINGSSFSETFTYVVLATGIYSFLQVWLEWRISPEIINGNIAVRLIKPIDYQVSMLAEALGASINNLVVITIPTIIIVYIIEPKGISLGINIVFFLISLVFSYLLNFCIDFSIGLMAFYTESIWGISAMKETIVLFLSGAMIPVYFFPEKLRTIVKYLPFQSIYNSPIQLLQNNVSSVSQMVNIILLQIIWTIALLLLTRVFYVYVTGKLMINGG